MKNLKKLSSIAIATLISLLAGPMGWADISNIASVTYRDAANQSYSANSNTATVALRPVITGSLSVTADVGVPFSYFITGTNSPTSYSASGLPAGLTVNTATGQISGTPTSAGTSNASISATNAAGTGSATLTITVRGNANVTLTKSASPATGGPGTVVTFTVQYRNVGSGTASSVVITDNIPAGSTLVAGSISGGGTLSGSTIQWTVGSLIAGANGSVSFQVTIN